MGTNKPPRQLEHLFLGILLCIAVAVVSYVLWVSYRPISSLMWAFIASIIIANVTNLPKRLTIGVNFLLKGSSESRHRRLGHRHERADFAASGSRVT